MGAGVWPGRSTKSSRARSAAAEVTVARRSQARHRCRYLLRVGVAVAFVVVVASQRHSLLAATDRLGRVSPAWLVLAVAAETVSFLAAAELQHQLLAGTGTRVDRRCLIALSYATTAMSATLPAGPAVSGRYSYRALTRRGSTAGAATWVLAAAAVLSIVSLALLGVIGAQLRGLGVLCSLVGGVLGVAVVLVAAGAVSALVWSSRHRRRLEQLVRSWSARGKLARGILARRLGLQTRPADTDTVGWLSGAGVDQHRAIGPARLSVALGLAGANWLLDVAALAIAFVALGLEVPWQGLLLAYAVTQLATSIPVLPGSIGVAEGSMAAALVCSGVHPGAAVAGVLVYRLVSFWLVLPAGWLAWRYLDRHEARPVGAIARRRGRERAVA
jgi:putative heme transporter